MITEKPRIRVNHDTVIEYEDAEHSLEFHVQFEPVSTSCHEPLVKPLPDGRWVVGYLSVDPDPQNPLESCAGLGKLYDRRCGYRTNQQYWEHVSTEPRLGWEVDMIQGRTVYHTPLSVFWDVYDHSGEVWRVRGSGRFFPDEQWDVTQAAGIWVPGDACLEHIHDTAQQRIIPEALREHVHIGYYSQEPYGKDGRGYLNRILVRIDVNAATKPYLFEIPRFARHAHLLPDQWNLFPKGYRSFEAAIKAALRALKISQPTKVERNRLRQAVARECSASACEVWNRYCSGDCYGVCVEVFTADGEDCVDEDACWGHLGGDYAKEELAREVDGTVKQLTAEAGR